MPIGEAGEAGVRHKVVHDRCAYIIDLARDKIQQLLIYEGRHQDADVPTQVIEQCYIAYDSSYLVWGRADVDCSPVNLGG